MPMGWRVFAALVTAGAIVMAVTIGGLWWFNTEIFPVLRERGLAFLFAPGLLVYVFGIGYVWYKIFIFAMGLFGALDN